VYVNHDLQLKVRLWYKISNYITISGVRTILRHLHRCSKVKTNFVTCPKLGHGREHDLGHILDILSPMTLSRTRPQFDNSSVIIAGDWNVVQDY
jgi:hypothetical protein